MKTRFFKPVLALLVIAANGGAFGADQPAATNAQVNTNGIGPRIQFDLLDYDFGHVKIGTKVKHDYVFTNTGDATLKIASIVPGCHCTTVGEWTHEVEPGKTGVIPIQFDSTGFPGPIVRTPMVSCNAKGQPSVQLRLHGTVIKPLEVTPQYLSFTISPDSDEQTNGVVHIVNNEDEPLVLMPPTSSESNFTADLVTKVPGKNFDLIIKTVPPLRTGSALDPGISQASIKVQSAASNSQPISAWAIATVQPVVSATPRQITVPAGPLQTNETFTVLLKNNGSRPLNLSDASVNFKGAEATVSASQPGKAYIAAVDFPAGFQAKPGEAMVLSIKTDHPRFPVLNIPIRQAIATPPRAAAQNVRMTPPAATAQAVRPSQQ